MLSDEIQKIASVIGESARSKMLIMMMDGRAYTAGELAIRADVSAQTASNHLAKLQKVNLVICEPAGRYRYYRLASECVANTLEAIGLLGSDPKSDKLSRRSKLDPEICFARSCYDHLAGELGVKLTSFLLSDKIIIQTDNEFLVTKSGKLFFSEWGIDIDLLKKQKRQFAKPCLDWTERRHHIAGSLGAGILDYLLKNSFFIRSKKKPRVLVLTTKGRRFFAGFFNL